jgi:hypothetical protein
MHRASSLLLFALASGVGANVVIQATVSNGVLHLSRNTPLQSGTPFEIDQSDASNAGAPFWLDLSGAAKGWGVTYACPTGACDAATYAMERARAGLSGAFSVRYEPSLFQTGSLPYGTPGGARAGTLEFVRSTHGAWWAYGISLAIFTLTAGASVASASYV